ncbi:MAG: YigZ family protein [Lachnospiraceae bacterium]|nr:YigZ family protein [Lachnospiraceae bacterium]
MKVLMKPGTAEVVEKKSRFIASMASVETPEEATAFIESVKKKYWDAKHNCSAYIIGRDGEYTRCNDDGEPAQTAGLPMLEVLLHSEVRNVVVVVTRYFGGTLLGTGGLIRAYGQTVKEALANSEIGEEVKGIMLTIKAEYTLLGKIQYTLAQKGVEIMDTIYESDVMLTIRFRSELLDAIEKELINVTSGKIEICDRAECFYLQKE